MDVSIHNYSKCEVFCKTLLGDLERGLDCTLQLRSRQDPSPQCLRHFQNLNKVSGSIPCYHHKLQYRYTCVQDPSLKIKIKKDKLMETTTLK